MDITVFYMHVSAFLWTSIFVLFYHSLPPFDPVMFEKDTIYWNQILFYTFLFILIYSMRHLSHTHSHSRLEIFICLNLQHWRRQSYWLNLYNTKFIICFKWALNLKTESRLALKKKEKSLNYGSTYSWLLSPRCAPAQNLP